MSCSNLVSARGEAEATSQIVIHPDRDEDSGLPTSVIGFHPGGANLPEDVELDFPSPGDQFLHFQIIEEMGRGAFARVYLARQDSLAHRLVVLKLSTLICGEPQKLARLQHGNIVPVYSVHSYGKIEAICMPYLGRVTLQAVISTLGPGLRPVNGQRLLEELHRLREPNDKSPLPEQFKSLERMSLVDASLWLTAQLAAGLAHAHRRGILHRDLKPANVLFTNDAVPMLLDFNVSSDAGRNSAAERIGGTFPYMAPEHLEAFDGAFTAVDERSDLYSLGVILYQLLTGRLPHPITPELEEESEKHSRMIAQHRRTPVRPSTFNPAIPPSVDSILLKLLDPVPARRYQRADDLHGDLTRHLTNLPLKYAANTSVGERARKWRRRNPRLATALSVAAIALLLLFLPAAAVTAEQARQTARAREVQQVEALNTFAVSHNEMQSAAVLLASRNDPEMREQGLAAARNVLARYGVLDDAQWQSRPSFALLDANQQGQLRSGLGGLLILMTRADAPAAAERWNGLAAVLFGEHCPAVVERQRGELAGEPRRAIASTSHEMDLYFDGVDLAAAGRCREALPLLSRFTRLQPDHFHGWFARGMCHDVLGQHADALAAFAVCVSLKPDFPHAYLNRGLSQLKLRRYAEAEADFTRALELKEKWLFALINRGIARDWLRRPQEAAADYTAALEQDNCPTKVWLLRARSKRALGDQAGFAADREQGMKRGPADYNSFRTRGAWHMEAREYPQAIADFDAALKLHPGDTDSLLNKGIVLADYLHKEAEAIPVFDRLLELAPENIDARCSRGVYHARLGHVAEARRDAEDSLKADSSAYRQFQAAGLYAQLSKTDVKYKDEAVKMLARSMRCGFKDAALLKSDHDLDPIRGDSRVIKLLSAVEEVDSIGR